jgi:hypothetical protein
VVFVCINQGANYGDIYDKIKKEREGNGLHKNQDRKK